MKAVFHGGRAPLGVDQTAIDKRTLVATISEGRSEGENSRQTKDCYSTSHLRARGKTLTSRGRPISRGSGGGRQKSYDDPLFLWKCLYKLNLERKMAEFVYRSRLTGLCIYFIKRRQVQPGLYAFILFNSVCVGVVYCTVPEFDKS